MLSQGLTPKLYLPFERYTNFDGGVVRERGGGR